MTRDELAALDAAATRGPWTGYSEPDVGLPWSLFEGVPGQTGFVPLEPLTGSDVNLIAYLRNHVPDILALIDENERLREANDILEDALQEVGDDYPGSSCQEWCQQQVKAARAALNPPQPVPAPSPTE